MKCYVKKKKKNLDMDKHIIYQKQKDIYDPSIFKNHV